jgi:biofilm protein TabA
MIVDTLSRAGLYHALHPSFSAAFDYLRAFDPATPDGRVDLEGTRMFALPQSYVTEPAAQRRFEAHRRYIDIQYLLAGEEVIEHSDVVRLTVSEPYHEERDVMFFHDVAGASLTVLRAGDFAIYHPQDAHKPCCQHAGPSPVHKVVIKIPV